MKEYYKILGVNRESTAEEIKSTFRAKAKKYHPDVNKEPDAHEQFIKIGEAYEILSNPDTRREYDNLIQAQRYNTNYNQEKYNDFQFSQEKAYKKAQYYSNISLEEILTSILKFTYELGRTAIIGERGKPEITLWDYIRLGFYGILLTFCIAISFTGVGTIPAFLIGRGILKGMNKNGKMIGIAPLFISTIVADGLVIFLVFLMLDSMF